jgi:hypothetical protein
MADPSRGVYEGDLAILERLAQTVLLTGSQAQPPIAVSGRHVATRKSQVERLERAVPNLVRFSALPKGLSDEQLEEVAVRRHLPQPACECRGSTTNCATSEQLPWLIREGDIILIRATMRT